MEDTRRIDVTGVFNSHIAVVFTRQLQTLEKKGIKMKIKRLNGFQNPEFTDACKISSLVLKPLDPSDFLRHMPAISSIVQNYKK